MIFDVVLLRRDGRKRLQVDVLRQMPIRGDVSTEDTGARMGLIALLTVDGAARWRLEHCRITRIAADSLVLSGVETVDGDLRHRQAWWCRLPPPGSDGPHPFDPDPPSAVRRDRSYAPAKA